MTEVVVKNWKVMAVGFIKFVAAFLKEHRRVVFTTLILVLIMLTLIPWHESFKEISALVVDDEVLESLVEFVKLSMAVMILPVVMALSCCLKR